MINRENFEKLSAYLRSLPPDYEDFDMSVYGPANQPPGTVCGSVGCALGHGIAAGVPMTSVSINCVWMNYCRCHFSDKQDVYYWCFGDDWEHFNNTPKGAAERIDYMLDHGVPKEVEYFDFFCEDDGPAKDWTDKLYGYERGGSR